MTHPTNHPTNQPSNHLPDTCTYCDQPAVSGGYLQPAMCRKHHSLAILISMLKARGQITSLENIRMLAVFFPRAGLDPNEIPALLESMKEQPE